MSISAVSSISGLSQIDSQSSINQLRQSFGQPAGQTVGSAHQNGHHQPEASGPDSSSTATDPAAPTGIVSGGNSAGGKISLYA
jgi:hypothetical protein